MDDIAILIPCYNEEKTIGKVVKDAHAALPNATVYVYDNNSSDQTSRIALANGALVRPASTQGKGNVIRKMFREIQAKCYIMVDGDDTYPMEAAAHMADLVLHRDIDMVIGDRLSSTYFTENKRPFHNLGNKIVRSSINHLFDCDISDIMTGFRAFSYEFVKTFPILSEGFEIETEMTIHAVNNHMQIANVVIDYRDRQEGSTSKLSTFRDGRKVLETILRLYLDYKPLVFLGSISLFLFALSAVFMLPILDAYWKTGEVRRFPTLIVCGFSVIAALQAFFSGIILHILGRFNRRDFELRILQISQSDQLRIF